MTIAKQPQRANRGAPITPSHCTDVDVPGLAKPSQCARLYRSGHAIAEAALAKCYAINGEMALHRRTFLHATGCIVDVHTIVLPITGVEDV